MRPRRLEEALKTLGEAMDNVGEVLKELRAEHDPLASHIFLARRYYGKVLDADTKSGKRSEQAAYSSWKEACELGFRGDLSEWRRLLGAMPRR